MYRTVVIGAGPGGTGPLIWSAQNGLLNTWLDDGMAVLDSRGAIGGTIGRYVVNSDTSASVYLEFLEAPSARQLFGDLLEDPSTLELRRLGDAYPPLALVQTYLNRFGALLERVVASAPNSVFKPFTTVRTLQMIANGRVLVEIETADGSRDQISTEAVIMALGGWQNPELIQNAPLLSNLRLKDFAPEKIVPSDRFLSLDGVRDAVKRLKAQSGRVIVLGGSHSAYSCVWALLEAMPEIDFAPGQIAMLYRRQPKIFYRSGEDAEADRYVYSEADICPRTKRVHRLGGLRSDGREMWRRLSGCPGTVHETRVQMIQLDDSLPATQMRRMLNEAALIVPAFGYRSRTVPVFDAQGRPVPLAADSGGIAVGQDARFLTQTGDSVPNLFGIGLGRDIAPWGVMGGEPSFDGQANSLWLYQHGIGEMVYRGVRNVLDQGRPIQNVARSPSVRRGVDLAGYPSLRTI